MPVFKSDLLGTMIDYFIIGGPDGPLLKNNSGTLEHRSAGDSDFATARALNIVSSGSGLNDIPVLLDLQGRCPTITWSFAGSSPPAAGTNTSEFGICHTTGGAYTAGRVYYDNGSLLLAIPTEVCRALYTAIVVTGDISLIDNGSYSSVDGVAWELRGDGGSSTTGLIKTIEVPYSYSDTGGKSSTTTIPSGARVLMVRNIVETIFNNTPTLTVIVDGTSDESIMGISDSDLTTVGEYHNEDTHLITSSNTGVIKVTVGGTPSAGAGRVLISFVTPLA
ncbi:hypothetical protein A2V94_07075 [Candidatus Atribacteria bacterium RBG_16_35_8]|nr:MAG: hypothetical protein A2V94_07075 [Candidatus Atribacteria bacterium RBG_16_35_8]